METNQNLKKRIAASSIAALMALTVSIGIHNNHSIKYMLEQT